MGRKYPKSISDLYAVAVPDKEFAFNECFRERLYAST
jgi:hypothetical protein